MRNYLLAIDQGTTSSRAIIFSAEGHIVSQAQQKFKQYFPQSGWVEHDPEDIWRTTLHSCRMALAEAKLSARDILAAGISNQRETTVLWHKDTGEPVYPAIVWQDRRTADDCQQLRSSGVEAVIREKTGLLLDPYFSAPKIQWILRHVPAAKSLANAGKLAFGTIDSFLLWRLTKGRSHATDMTNAARTLLFNLHQWQWDDELLNELAIPASILPTIKPNCAEFGMIDKSWLGAEIPITAMLGDQQAATVGQACFQPGMVKSTYGTGCFMLLNTGTQLLQSKHRLLTTVAYHIQNQYAYALEGSSFIAGAGIEWLRDKLALMSDVAETEAMVNQTEHNGGVYLVPAFTGLGAPYWQPLARAAIVGLTRDSSRHHLVRAALEAVAYQSKDLLLAMQHDGATPNCIRVDGGMVVNQWLMQFLADMLGITVTRASIAETTALGAAFCAGLGSGLYSSLAAIESLWQSDRDFLPQMSSIQREKLYQGWLQAVAKVCSEQTVL